MTTVLHARHAGEPSASPEARHQIGVAARHVGVSTSALRLWERQGLLRPSRTGSGYRLYSDADLVRLRRIRHMRAEQVSARGILRLLAPGATRGRGEDGDRGLDGSRLRRLRRERGLSLRAAADGAGLSTSFLSALERNATGASVATLQRLTHALGVTMLDLLPPRQPRGRRVRPQDREALSLGSGVRIEQLARNAELLEPQLFVLAPSAASEGAYAHEGEEFIYVLEGGVTIWIGAEERHRLAAGDSLTFPSTLPHRWRNRADGDTRLLWINTPPTF
jgi:DNA-binding transcriptional MerR regulator/quercetin dioxygenase-like cupin family protein